MRGCANFHDFCILGTLFIFSSILHNLFPDYLYTPFEFSKNLSIIFTPFHPVLSLLGSRTETEVINGPGFREVITDTQRRGWNGQVTNTETEVIQTPGFTEVITENQQPGWGGGWGR